MSTLPQNPASVNALEPLTLPEAQSLAQCEAVISSGLQTFVEVGEALAAIHSNRLYRDTHATFEDYCQGRWGFTRQRARQLIKASVVAAEMTTNGLHLDSERQARLVGKLKDRGDRQAAVEEAIAVRGKVSPKKLQEAVEKRLAREDPPRAERTQWTAEAVAEWETCLRRLPMRMRDGVAALICQPGVGPDKAIRLAGRIEIVVGKVQEEVTAAFKGLGRG